MSEWSQHIDQVAAQVVRIETQGMWGTGFVHYATDGGVMEGSLLATAQPRMGPVQRTLGAGESNELLGHDRRPGRAQRADLAVAASGILVDCGGVRGRGEVGLRRSVGAGGTLEAGLALGEALHFLPEVVHAGLEGAPVGSGLIDASVQSGGDLHDEDRERESDDDDGSDA